MKTFILKLVFLAALGLALVDIDPFVPTTLNDFFLPGSQPGDSGNLENPDKCDNCHGGYDQEVEPAFNWRGSMMSQSARDPLFYAAMTIANQDAPQSGDLCIRCHSPKGWLEGRSVPTDGSALTPADREGVQCDFCHKLVKPTMLGVNPFPGDSIYFADTYDADQDYLAILDSIPDFSANGMYIADASNTKRGPFADAEATHQFYYSPFHPESAICGTCHDVSNPAFSAITDTLGNIIDYAPNAFDEPAPDFTPTALFPVERTYSEWAMSAYNTPEGIAGTVFGGNKAFVATCQDCHMKDVTGKGCNKNNAPVRDDLPHHDMTGGNTFIPLLIDDVFPGEADTAALADGIERARWMLQNAATLEVDFDSLAQTIEVRAYNETGHKLPSGYPEGRRIWLNVKAWGANGEYYESGAYDMDSADLFLDSDIKVYEIKPGISPALGVVLGLPAGPSFHFVLNDTIYKDNRIPPRGFTNANFDSIQSPVVDYAYADSQYYDDTFYPVGFDPLAFVVAMYYQTVSKEYVLFLRDENVTDDWGQTFYDLWDNYGRSPPELMVESAWGEPVVDNDGDGWPAFIDCNDDDADIYPGAVELFDCLDNDCDGLVDEDFTSEVYHVWTGCAGNQAWDDPVNWNMRSVPTANNVVIVPSVISGTGFPVISGLAEIHKLTIESLAELEISSSGSLVIDSLEAGDGQAIALLGTLDIHGSLYLADISANAIMVGVDGFMEITGSMLVERCSGLYLENYGLIEIEIAGQLTFSGVSGSAFVNHPAAEINNYGTWTILK